MCGGQTNEFDVALWFCTLAPTERATKVEELLDRLTVAEACNPATLEGQVPGVVTD